MSRQTIFWNFRGSGWLWKVPEKTSKLISTIVILRPVKAIFEKRAATVEVDAFVSVASQNRDF